LRVQGEEVALVARALVETDALPAAQNRRRVAETRVVHEQSAGLHVKNKSAPLIFEKCFLTLAFASALSSFSKIGSVDKQHRPTSSWSPYNLSLTPSGDTAEYTGRGGGCAQSSGTAGESSTIESSTRSAEPSPAASLFG
jgi:hypothetical protein